jgi:quinol monooxygenase YgiN
MTARAMITYITHMRIRPENAAAYEAVIARMTRNVAVHEPGVLHYQCSRSAEDPEVYMDVEIYRDEAAFIAHWQTDYIRPLLARAKPLVEEGSLESRRYESV